MSSLATLARTRPSRNSRAHSIALGAAAAAVTATMLLAGARPASASYYVRCDIRIHVLKVIKRGKKALKTRFRVLKILEHSGHSRTACNRFAGKTLVRSIVLINKRPTLRKGQKRVVVRSFSHGRASPRRSVWFIK